MLEFVISKGRHPKNAINKVLYELNDAWFEVVEVHKGHRWGKVVCRECGMTVPIWSTPRVPEHNADAIRRFMHNHKH
ncbi:hypothetical protein [Propionimicrobium sp. PCR01-08-3]|uniref:hypothetical protein n=1 Tax=Propionimicrobium sp. PCR01-08-3 TaxID=3052086 RepID=UPI00255CB25C|nr:hypothetical protein [Propionimicrobium sp. PCR01-08-3]WIY83715.1 hypothetical protein QQ658_05015 [Propionimicrobium sp. PCR01-08-3]